MTHKCQSPYGCGNISTVTENDQLVTDVVKEDNELGEMPEPMVFGNDKVAITKHALLEIQIYNCMYKISVDFAIKNVSDKTVATLVFEARFYNKNGKLMDTIVHRENDFRPGMNRGIDIPSNAVVIPGIVKSYEVRIIKMTTTETEKVQLRNQDMKIDPMTGEAELKGIVKNISDAKTDAVLMLTFSNFKKEVIGDKVIFIRDIDPGQMKRFYLKYKPYGGEMVDGVNAFIASDIAEMAEETK
jgi:hypothetical protein